MTLGPVHVNLDRYDYNGGNEWDFHVSVGAYGPGVYLYKARPHMGDGWRIPRTSFYLGAWRRGVKF